MSSQHQSTEPSFPTQADLRALVAELDANALGHALLLDPTRFRAIVDLDGIVVAVNDYAERVYGTDPEQILEHPFWEDPIFSGDPLWEGRLRSRFAETLAAESGTIEYEDHVDLPNGSALHVRVRLSVLRSAAGDPIGFLADALDVAREYRSRALVAEQQRLLHLVFERTFQLIAILDPTGRVIDVNDAVEAIGLTRERAIGRTIMELAGPEGPERVGEWQERIDLMQTATEPRRYFDVTDGGLNGAQIAADVSMTPVRNDDGTLDLILLEFRDQTERHAAEGRLRESEERFRALAETLPQMVWATGTDGRIEYFGPRWVDFTGLPLDELVAAKWVRLVHPDDRDLATARPAPGVLEDHREFRMLDRHGEYRWMESQARPALDEDGNVRRWYGATLDITQRREAEDLFRAQSQQIEAAAELAGLGSFVWEASTRTLRTDERFDRILGFNVTGSAGGAERANFLGRVHPDDRERIASSLQTATQPGGGGFNQQYRVMAEGPSGPEERWIACVASTEFDDDGTVTRMFGAIQDVTIARRQDESRVRLQKVEAIGTLVGAIAHDFNNVIGAILTYARVAEAEMASGEQPAESVAEIARGARRAADILGRLMAFGREETPRRIRFDGAEVIDEAVALIRPALPNGATIDVEIAEDLPPLDGDPTQIHQAVVNLLTNACQAIGDMNGRGRITVRGVAVELDASSAEGEGLEAGRYVRLSVQDNGRGFDKGVAHRLFDPFFTTKAAGEGTGLGLSAVQSIVRAHHGAVSANAPSEGGAMFTVLLPAVHDASSSGHVAPGPALEVDVAKARAPRPTTRRSGPIRALFVDDEPALVRLASRAMPYRDIEVSGHTDASDALEAFRAAPDDFDVLVTDLSMPNLSGFELVDAIHAVRAGLPVVLTSGYMGPADEQAATDRQIDAVLPKPCSIDALAAAVQRVTGH